MISAHSFMPRHSFLLPQVYIHPPPEESLPSYCFFDGAQDSDSVFEPEHAAYEAELDFRSSLENGELPIFNRDSIEQVIMPRKRFEDDDQYEDYGQDITIRGEEPASELSEVIEVIKVSRKSSSTPVPAAPHSSRPKRSETFISRAFRSIKNVNRAVTSLSKKPGQQSSEQDTPVPIALSTTSSATESISRPRRFSRRSSVNLAQLFTRPPSPSQSIPPSLSESETKPRSLRHSYSTVSTRPELLEDDADSIDTRSIERSSSPTPSTATFSVRKRFSVLNLFSRNPSSPALNVADVPPAIQKMRSSDSLGPFSSNCSASSKCSSSSSSAGPFTPTEPAASFDSGIAFNPAVPFEHPAFSTPVRDSAPPSVPPKGALLKRLPSLIKKSDSKYGSRAMQESESVLAEPVTQPVHNGDVSFEMRLDSLHFDELSFDVDKF